MTARRSNVEKLSAGVTAVVFGSLALTATFQWRPNQGYGDFIVGSSTFTALPKTQDLIALPVFALVATAVGLFVHFHLEQVATTFGARHARGVANQLLGWSFPALAALAGFVLTPGLDPRVLLVSGAGMLCVLVTSLAYQRHRVEHVPSDLGYTALAVSLLALLPLEVALVLGRAPVSLTGGYESIPFTTLSWLVLLGGLVAATAAAWLRPAVLERCVPLALLVGQLGLAAFVLTLVPARLLPAGGELTKYDTTIWLTLLVVVAGAGILLDVVWRFQGSRRGPRRRFVSPPAIFALVLAVRQGLTVAPRLSSDDYHFGESLIGTWSYAKGAVPYVDYIPAHGLVGDDLRMFLSRVFFDGTATSAAEASRITFALLGFCAFLALYRVSGSLLLAVVSVLLIDDSYTWLFLTPFLCLWLSRSLRARPSVWLATWIVTAPIVVLGVPPQGVLIVAASGVVALSCVWMLWKEPALRSWKPFVPAVVIVAAAAVVLPLIPMLAGAVGYVVENGPINQVAYGRPWELSWNIGDVNSGFVFEIIRMSWVALLVVCLVVLAVGALRKTPRWRAQLIPAAVVLLFTVALITYTMGRIDPGGVSRPGLASTFAWLVLIPVVLWPALRASHRGVFIVTVAVAGAALTYVPLSVADLARSTSSTIDTPPLIDGARAGFPNVGTGYVDPQQWKRLTTVNEVLSARLAPGEPYLDVTSRNAQYFYLDRLPPVPITAAYNLVPAVQQKHAIDLLSANLPRVALLEGHNVVNDGGGVAVRNPYLYRFLLDRYTPVFDDGLILGVPKSSPDAKAVSAAVPSSDGGEWVNGVSTTRSALRVRDPYLLSTLAVGDVVDTAGGGTRRITAISLPDKYLEVSGPRLDPVADGHPHEISAPLPPERLGAYRTALFDASFGLHDLEKIPVAWGRSYSSLKDKMVRVTPIDSAAPITRQMSRRPDGSYKATGADPGLTYDLSDHDVAGADVGLLNLKFACRDATAEPRLRIYWWGDGADRPSEESSVVLTAEQSRLIVPLDASPRWLALTKLTGIRIDLENPVACSSVTISDVSLAQRDLS